jgi:hypothetical protein
MTFHHDRQPARSRGALAAVAVLAAVGLGGCAAMPLMGDTELRYGPLGGGEPPGDPDARDGPRPGLFTGEAGELVIFSR